MPSKARQLVTLTDGHLAGPWRMSTLLSPGGVDILSKDPSSESRALAAEFVGSAFRAGGLDDAEIKTAVAILELLSQDRDLKVRQAVCEQLLTSPSIPTSIARILARDVESIAVPILRRAKTLSDTDLVDSIRAGGTLKQVSIARRDIVSPIVSNELVTTVKRAVVKTVLANGGANIPEQSLRKVVDDFGNLSSIQSLLIDRPELPPTILPQLAPLLSGAMAKRLQERHHAPKQLFDGPRAESERPGMTPRLADQALKSGGTAEPKTMLRILSEGNFDLFILLMASLAGASVNRSRILINDAGKKGFGALYAQAGLPRREFPDFEVSLKIVLDARKEGWTDWDDATTQHLIGRYRRAYDNVGGQSLERILELLN